MKAAKISRFYRYLRVNGSCESRELLRFFPIPKRDGPPVSRRPVTAGL
jgi:hypothetical protein